MALYNEIFTGRLNRALQKMTGIKGGAAVKQLGSEILPVFPMFWGAEARYLESWNLFGISYDVTAAAANTSAFQLANPGSPTAGSASLVPTSNVIAVITKWVIINYSAAVITIYLEKGPIGATIGNLAGVPNMQSSSVNYDKRGNLQTSLIPSSTNLSGAVGSISNTPMIVTLPANAGMVDLITYEDQQLPLLPGDYIRLHNTVLNSPCTGFVMWRERYLEESERT
jgi:hypothetical protein